MAFQSRHFFNWLWPNHFVLSIIQIDWSLQHVRWIQRSKILAKVDHIPLEAKKNYYYNHCGYSFNKPSQLKTHLLVHSWERPFVCSQSNYFCTRACDPYAISFRRKVLLFLTEEIDFILLIFCRNCYKSGVEDFVFQLYHKSSTNELFLSCKHYIQ